MWFQRWWWLNIEAVAVEMEEVAVITAVSVVCVAVAPGMLPMFLLIGNK